MEPVLKYARFVPQFACNLTASPHTCNNVSCNSIVVGLIGMLRNCSIAVYNIYDLIA